MDSAFRSAFASASLQVIFEKIATLAIKEIGLILEVDDQVEKLERTVERIQALFVIVESNQFNHKTWRFRLQDVWGMLYDANDLLDEISVEFSRVKSKGSMNGTDRNPVFDQVLSSVKISLPHAIDDILKKLEGVAKEIEISIMTEMMRFNRHEIMTKRCGSSSFLDESAVTGREKDTEEIMSLVFGDVQEEIAIIPVVGMGGIGKTMLAQVIYNAACVAEAFDLRIWISMSVSLSVMEVTKSIVESTMGKTLKLSNLDLIQLKLRELIEGKKIFLVLDDMWDENPQNWDVMKLPFRAAARGSRILVTTRSTFVSTIISTIPPYKLQPLSNEDCWKLIKQRAFSDRDTRNVENFEVIGGKIAKKCEGIPLVANTFGSVLRLKSEEKQWDDLLRTELWDLSEVRNMVFSSLRLSFDQLSPHLKMCFVYCSLFPYNYEFERENLAHLWAAEGFIQARETRRVEDIGRDYFDELFCRSFFYTSHVNKDSHQQIYKMHGLIHKLGELIFADMCFRLEDGILSLSSTCRHPRHSFMCFRRFQPAIWKVFHRYKGLRTLVVRTIESDKLEIPYDLFKHLQRLRVLNLSSTRLEELPESIENLKQLRYLDASQTLIKKLPESTANLCGLRYLKLRNCTNLHQLPKDMNKMIELLHLDLEIRGIGGKLTSMPLDFGKLTKLQTLPVFIVGKDRCSPISELRNLKDIRGSLCITPIENVRSSEEATAAMLENKSHVEILKLQWDQENVCLQDSEAQGEVLESLRPHNGLKELHILKYSNFTFPDWMSDPSFSKLVTINLLHCRYCRILLPLGQLPALESLYVRGMLELRYINSGFCGSGTITGFPSLKELVFYDMPCLETWNSWDSLTSTDMPRLCRLTIGECPVLNGINSLQHLRSLEKLEFFKCPKLKSLPWDLRPDSLEELIIEDCDILKEGYEKGADWSKIRGIPKIEIDGEEISVPQEGN